MIGLASDHGGFLLKETIKKCLAENNINFIDFGTDSESPVDYSDYANIVADSILSNDIKKGILICGTGIGISIAANRHKGIRAALCNDTFSARATREHNDANILALGARVIGEGLALEIVKTFLETEFSNEERHINRIAKLDK